MRVRAPQTLETLNAVFTVLFAAELLVNAFAHWFRDFVLNFWSMVRRRARRRAPCSRPLAETAEHASRHQGMVRRLDAEHTIVRQDQIKVDKISGVLGAGGPGHRARLPRRPRPLQHPDLGHSHPPRLPGKQAPAILPATRGAAGPAAVCARGTVCLPLLSCCLYLRMCLYFRAGGRMCILHCRAAAEACGLSNESAVVRTT